MHFEEPEMQKDISRAQRGEQLWGHTSLSYQRMNPPQEAPTKLEIGGKDKAN